MSEKVAYLYVLDTLADWEPGHLTAELNTGRFFATQRVEIPVRTVGLDHSPITTMGGLRVTPDVTVDEVSASHAAVLILPGGDTWLEPRHAPILAKARELLGAGTVVAAICGATMALANDGMLDARPHTSNDPNALTALCPGYAGSAHYRTEPAVRDGNLITASGLAPIEFAHATLAALDVLTPATLDAWYRLNTTREPAAYEDLMASVSANMASSADAAG